MRPSFISVTGPPGAGKTRLIRNFLDHYPTAQILESITTREPRPSDLPGEYRHVSEHEFQKLSRQGEFAWEVQPHGKPWYGTSFLSLIRALPQGIHVCALTPDTVARLHRIAQGQGFPESVHSFYLLLENEGELRRRMQERGDDPVDVEKRIATSHEWNALAKETPELFIFLDASESPEHVLGQALSHLVKQVLA